MIEHDNVTRFYTGGMGAFDQTFSSVVRIAKRKNKKIKLILVKPYFSNEMNRNKEYYESDFDDVIVPEELFGMHPKGAIAKRNRWMVEHCDMVIGCVYKDHGGAYEAVRYAERLEKLHINISDAK